MSSLLSASSTVLGSTHPVLNWINLLPSTYLLCGAAGVLCLALGLGWRHWARSSHKVTQPKRPRRASLQARLRRWGAHGSWCVGTVLAAALSVTLGINTYAGYIPSFTSLNTYTGSVPFFEQHFSAARGQSVRPGQDVFPQSNTASHGTVLQTVIPSTARDVPESKAMLYLPPGYEMSNAHYPVLYALHGSPGATPDWFVAGQAQRILTHLIRTGRIRPCILLTAQVTAGAHELDEPLNEPGGPQYETFITQDMVHWADTHLRTIHAARDRTIIGMSSGGLAALAIGIHTPHIFGNVVSLLPYLHPYTRLVTHNAQALAENAPVSETLRYPADLNQRFFLGQDGPGAQNARIIQQALQQSGRRTSLQIYPDQRHTWAAVRAMLPAALQWDSAPIHTTL